MSSEPQEFHQTESAVKGELQLGDAALVAAVIALIVLGNVAIVQAMDVALDRIAIASR